MKRFSLGLAAVGLTASLSAYAALPTTAAPFQVVIPNVTPGWEFNLTGYYLDPDVNDSDYAIVVNESPTAARTYNLKAENPGFDWAIGVGLGYVFPCTGNDIRASWIHFFEHNNTDYFDEETVGINVTPTFNTDFDIDFNDANGTQDFQYDAVDLNVGQFVDLGTRLQMRLFAGLRYAHIERDFDVQLEDVVDFTTDYLDIDSNSKFDGIGPLFGVDSSYHFGNCWGLAGHFDATLLVGDVKTSDSFTTPEVSVGATTFNTVINSDDVNRVVPGFDGKLGLDWSTPVGCDGWFTAELGWQWTVYVDVFDRFQPGETTVLDTPVQIEEVSRISSNFGFDGPYLSLNLKI